LESSWIYFLFGDALIRLKKKARLKASLLGVGREILLESWWLATEVLGVGVSTVCDRQAVGEE